MHSKLYCESMHRTVPRSNLIVEEICFTVPEESDISHMLIIWVPVDVPLQCSIPSAVTDNNEIQLLGEPVSQPLETAHSTGWIEHTSEICLSYHALYFDLITVNDLTSCFKCSKHYEIIDQMTFFTLFMTDLSPGSETTQTTSPLSLTFKGTNSSLQNNCIYIPALYSLTYYSLSHSAKEMWS